MLGRKMALSLVFFASTAVSSSVLAQPLAKCSPYPFRDFHQASECKRALRELERNIYEYELKLATFAIDVTVTVPKKSNNSDSVEEWSYSSHGTGFLVHLERGWFITAKHVIIGNAVWDLDVLKQAEFPDFEIAIDDLFSPENPLRRPGKTTIKIRPFLYSARAFDATVVAFDRSNDLALLQVENIDELQNEAFADRQLSIFEPVRLADRVECKRSMIIRALGYIGDDVDKRELRRSGSGTVENCLLKPQTIPIGGLYFQFPLYETDAKFVEGMSGGPVFVEDPSEIKPPVVGVVSAGVPGGDHNYYVPAAAVVNFLEKFGYWRQ